MAKATVVGSLVERRGGEVTAHLEVEGLDGWMVTAALREGPTGQHIVELRVAATRPDLVLTGEQLRRVTPADIIRAMNDPWLLSTTPTAAQRRPRGPDRYLRDLVNAALKKQGTAPSLRRALAEQFKRTEGQIRDDLHRARLAGYLMPSSPGSRLLQVGPRFAELSGGANGRKSTR